MNQNEALEQFYQILTSYKDQIISYSELCQELLSIVKESGNEKHVKTVLAIRLEFLTTYKNKAHVLHKEFERIDSDIYSLHVETKNANIRILYGFLNEKPVLLRAFYERSGKRATDYTREITIASQRLSELKKENVE